MSVSVLGFDPVDWVNHDLAHRHIASLLNLSEVPRVSGSGHGDIRVSFASFLEKTLSCPSAEVRRLAENGPNNLSTKVKDATYSITGMIRDAAVNL